MEFDWVKDSRDALVAEFKWILKEEAFRVLKDVREILTEGSRRFPLHLTIENTGIENLVKPDRFLLSNSVGAQNIKAMVTLMGDNICEADVTLRLPSSKNHAQYVKTAVQPDNCWKLQQLQDAGNYLSKALGLINSALDRGHLHSGKDGVTLVNGLINCLSKGRSCIVVPKRKSVEELIGNVNKRALRPPLPNEVAISFYVHATKLVLALYHLQYSSPGQVPLAASGAASTVASTAGNGMSAKVEITDRFQAEVLVPWFNDIIVLFTAALQQCQQLKDKIMVFSQYPDAPPDALPQDDSVNTISSEEHIIIV